MARKRTKPAAPAPGNPSPGPEAPRTLPAFDAEHHVWVLKVQAMPLGVDAPPAARRMARMVKSMLRAFSFKLVDLRSELPPVTEPGLRVEQDEPPFAPPTDLADQVEDG